MLDDDVRNGDSTLELEAELVVDLSFSVLVVDEVSSTSIRTESVAVGW